MPAPNMGGGGGSGPNMGGGASSGGSNWGSGSGGVAPVASQPKAEGPGPGTFGVDVTSPQAIAGSMAENVASVQQYTSGLSAALFGTHQAGTDGENQGGLPIISDIGRAFGRVPIIGPALGMAGEAGAAMLSAPIAGGSKLVEVASDAIGKVEVPGNDIAKQKLREAFAAIPDSPEKQAIAAEMARDPDFEQARLYDAVHDFAVANNKTNPELFPEFANQPTTIGDTLQQAFDMLTVGTSRYAQRLVGGSDIRADGLSRMDGIDQVARGISVFTQGDKAMTDAERIAWEHWSGGTWSIDQANDFLAASDQGISHDARLQMASAVALDPQVWGSLGASALSKLGIAGVRLLAPEAVYLTKGTRGQVIAEAVGMTEKEGAALYDSMRAMAKVNKVEVGDLPSEAWQQLATQGGHGLTAERVEEVLLQAVQEGRNLRRANVLGQIAKTEKAADLVRIFGGLGVGSVTHNQYLGQAAKVARTIIDPFHLMGGRGTISEAHTDLLSEVAPRIADESYGQLASAQVVHWFHDIKPGMGLQDAAGFAANAARKVATKDHINAQMAAALLHPDSDGALTALRGADVNAVAEAATANAPRNLLDSLKVHFVSVQPTQWGPTEMKDLAMRLHASYGDSHGGNGPATVEEWLAELSGRSTDQLNKLHGMTHQNLASRLSDAVGAAKTRLGPEVAAELELEKLYLMRRGTLTTAGVQGILDRMTANATNLAAQVEEMRAAQQTYPELRFIQFREVNPQDSVDGFIRVIEQELRTDRFPTQLLDSEIASLPDEVKAVDTLVSGTFTLAKRPGEEGLMGLTRDASGRLVQAYEPWVDHVSSSTVKAHGTFATDHNILGIPLASIPGGKAIDVIDAGLRTTRAMVQTEVITVRATHRFQTLAGERFGLAPEKSKELIEAIQNAAGIRNVTVRGLKATNMEEAVRGLLPRNSRMTVADILNLTLEAYEGDLRYVGLTQKFTGRAKVVFGKSGSNFAGQISEDLYQKIRFQYNLVFQAQEKIEPWVLSAQRGVMPSFGTVMTESDKFAARIAQNLRDTGMMRAAAIDQAEWASYAVAGSELKQVLARSVDPSFMSDIRDVRGTKFVNMNRVAAESSSQHIKAVLDKTMPGYFDRLREWDTTRLGHVATDQEVVFHWLNEGGLTHGWEVPDVIEPGIGAKLFNDHIKVGEMMRPVDMGELRGIDLNWWAARTGMIDSQGHVLVTEMDLRNALGRADSGITRDAIRDALMEHGAHPTQAERAVTSLDFNFNTFSNNLHRRYNLTTAEQVRIEDTLARMASQRGMSPSDFLSQVFSPTIAGGEEAAVGQLGALVDVMRAGRMRAEGDVARLGARVDAAGAPLATSDDLMRNLATVFSAHLDPSARWTLLQEFKPELEQAILDGTIHTDMATLEEMWAQGADHWLAQQLTNYTEQTALAQTIEEYTARRPMFPRPRKVYTQDGVVLLPGKVVGPLGSGIAPNTSHAVRAELLSEWDRLHNSVPGVNVHLDIADLHTVDPYIPDTVTAAGATYEVDGGGYAVYLDEMNFGPETAESWDHLIAEDARLSRSKTFHSDEGYLIDRRSNMGAPYSADPTMLGTVRHEHAHAVHEYIRSEPQYADIAAYLDEFSGSDAARQLSETAMMNDEEAAAEVLSLVTDPEADLTRFTTRPSPRNFDDLPPLSDTEYWRDVPANERPDYVSTGPETVEEAVTALREKMTAAGLLRAPSAVSPDVARASQMFGRWTTNVVRDGLALGDDSMYAELLNRIALIPTEGAVPYNLNHGLMVQQVENAMVRGSEDAFRLNFFKQNRSWAERSLNHPFFGIYPASYMWGKIAPEMARFMMSRPFGVQTGAASYIAKDIAQQFAARTEFDPEFQKALEGASKSDIGWFLSYLLPALPWDVGAALPAWTRDLSQQGLDNQARVDKGVAPKPVSLTPGIQKIGDYVSPARQVEQVLRPLDELGEITQGTKEEQKRKAADSYIPPDGTVTATELSDPLTDAMTSLRDIFVSR